MAGTRPSLAREDWIAAGFAALLEAGPDAVAVQPLAARLGATKGSFYWHFTARDDLLRAVLDRWREAHTEAVITWLEGTDPAQPRERLRQLLLRVTEASEDAPGEQRILAAADDPLIAGAVAEVTRRRMHYVEHLLGAAGLPPEQARRRAWLGYTWFLGHAQLSATVPDAMPADRSERRRMLDEVVDFLLDDDRG